jgi:hypothetical protein
MSSIKLLVAIMLTILCGCADNSALIKANNTNIRTDIFEDFTSGGIVPSGFSALRITATLKTHKPGNYSATDIHGTPEHRLLLNIDGQALLLRASIQKEDRESRGLVDPEAGDGVLYHFNKILRLKAGIHRVVVAFPADGIAIAKEITLAEGNVNSLVIKPLYGTTPGMRRSMAFNTTSFMLGLRGVSLTLNGQNI